MRIAWVVTNSSMHDIDVFSGVTYQVWRLSDLKLLKTEYLDVGANHYGHVSPEEPRVGPDGAVYVQTLGCGIERITNFSGDDLDKNPPQSKLVWTFLGHPAECRRSWDTIWCSRCRKSRGWWCWIFRTERRRWKCRAVKLTDGYFPHWTGWDPKARRFVVTGNNRLFLLTLDEKTGALALDQAFHDATGKPGFEFVNQEWPQGWTGTGRPHGVVFSR